MLKGILRRLRDWINRQTAPPARCDACRRPLPTAPQAVWNDKNGLRYCGLECLLSARDLDTPAVQRRAKP